CSKFGRTRLGGPEAKPDFSTFSWVAMLFSAGMGIGLVYFSVAEPMYHFSNPIESDLSDVQKAKYAMKHTFFHYGLHVWGIYALLGIALAYFCFNHKLPLSLRSTVYPFIGERIHGWIGNSIDVLAVLATLFGLATSLGFGAIQFSTGVSLMSGISNGLSLQIVAIIGITSIAILSVLSGLTKGLKYLSNLNMILAIVLLLFVLFIGQTPLLLDGFIENVGIYLDDFFVISTFRGAYASSGEWFKGWSMFYWAWWISWAPFVGTFIARISKGRTIREVAIYGLLLPSLFSFFWMSVFGGTAFELQFQEKIDIAAAVGVDSSKGLFLVLEQLPLTGITSFLTVLLVATFFVTSSDSGSLVVDYMTSGGKLDSPKGQKVFWASMEGAIAIALLVGGGLSALQSASLSTGFAFSVVLVVVSLSLLKALRNDRPKEG
ncbi:MAG: BCCT family transporter, partial [Bacteroidota bacterium]